MNQLRKIPLNPHLEKGDFEALAVFVKLSEPTRRALFPRLLPMTPLL